MGPVPSEGAVSAQGPTLRGLSLPPLSGLLVWPQPGGDTQGKFRFHPAFTQPKRPPGRAPVSSSSLAPMKLKLGEHTGVQTHMLGCLA